MELWELTAVERQAGTIRVTLDGVAQAFQTNKFTSSPVHDVRGRFDAILAAQLWGYGIEDPGTKQSQAVPAAVIAIVEAANASELHRSVGQLAVGGFYFAIRACEFSDVGGPRRTRTLTLGDIEFRRNGRRIESDEEDEIAAADTVSLTFRTQKNGEKGTTVSHTTSDRGDDDGSEDLFRGLICPTGSKGEPLRAERARV